MTTIGLLGAGGIAHTHLPGWLAQGFTVVIFSVDGQAPALAAKYGGRAVSSLEALLDTADIVDICTPTFTHRELAEQAAAAGKHIVCEKPLALTVADTEAIIAACDRAGVRLFPAHVVRYFPAYAAASEAIRNGRIGAPAIQRFARISTAPRQPWFSSDELSGGIAMDQMIHDFDYARWIAGPVQHVFATRVDGQSAPGESTVHAIMTHRSGTLSHVHGVWGAPDTRFQSSFTLSGVDGVLEHDSLAPTSMSIAVNISTTVSGYLPPVAAGESPYTAELRDFARAIEEDAPARVTPNDGLEAVRIAAAVNQSIATRSTITIEELH